MVLACALGGPVGVQLTATCEKHISRISMCGGVVYPLCSRARDAAMVMGRDLVVQLRKFGAEPLHDRVAFGLLFA